MLPRLAVAALLLVPLLAPLALPPAAALHACINDPAACCGTIEDCQEEIKEAPEHEYVGPCWDVCIMYGPSAICIYIQLQPPPWPPWVVCIPLP